MPFLIIPSSWHAKSTDWSTTRCCASSGVIPSCCGASSWRRKRGGRSAGATPVRGCSRSRIVGGGGTSSPVLGADGRDVRVERRPVTEPVGRVGRVEAGDRRQRQRRD